VAAEKNSQPKEETQTQTETAKEETPPDETVIKPKLIYFEAYQDANIPISAVNNNSPFVVRWKVDNKNGKVIIQSDSGLEKEGDMGTMPQQMGDVAMTYSLFAFDKENNVLSPSPWILTVESAEKEESMEVSNLKVETLEITPNKKEVRWKIDNFDSSMGLRMQVISNGVVIKDEVIPSGEGGMAI
jgi:hypothetical protein